MRSPRPFFSAAVHRWSFLVQNPRYTTFRELVQLLYTLFLVYHSFIAAARLRGLWLQERVLAVCGEQASGADCFLIYVRLTGWTVWLAAWEGLKWVPALAMLVFLWENVARSGR